MEKSIDIRIEELVGQAVKEILAFAIEINHGRRDIDYVDFTSVNVVVLKNIIRNTLLDYTLKYDAFPPLFVKADTVEEMMNSKEMMTIPLSGPMDVSYPELDS